MARGVSVVGTHHPGVHGKGSVYADGVVGRGCGRFAKAFGGKSFDVVEVRSCTLGYVRKKIGGYRGRESLGEVAVGSVAGGFGTLFACAVGVRVARGGLAEIELCGRLGKVRRISLVTGYCQKDRGKRQDHGGHRDRRRCLGDIQEYLLGNGGQAVFGSKG